MRGNDKKGNNIMRAIETQIAKKDHGRLSVTEDDMPGVKDLKVDDEIEVPIKAKLRSIDKGYAYGPNPGKTNYEFDITHVKSAVNPTTVDADKGEKVAGRKITR